MTKSDCIRRHAQNRAIERFGFRLTDELHDRLVAEFKRKRGCEKRVSCRIRIFRKTIEGIDMRIVYDRKRELIVTFWKVKRGGVANEPLLSHSS